MTISPRIRAREVDLVLLLVALFWGASYLAAKSLTQHAPVIVVLSLRFILTAIGMTVIWIIKRPQFSRNEELLGLALGSVQALIIYCETAGVSRTTATNAGLIISLAIVMTPLMESFASKNWLPPKFFAATIVAVVGVLLLVSNKGFSAPNLGDWLMLAAATVRALHVTSMGHFTKGKTYSSVNITLLQSIACALIFTAISGSRTFSSARHLPNHQWLGLLFLSGLCGVFAFLATLWAIRQTSSSRASLLLGTEPVWAVVVGTVLGGESLTLIGIIGALLIISATGYGQKIESGHRTDQALHSFEP